MNARSDEVKAKTVEKVSLECQTEEIVSQITRNEAGAQFEAVKILDAETSTTLVVMGSVETETE
jgi:hypothetical protein